MVSPNSRSSANPLDKNTIISSSNSAFVTTINKYHSPTSFLKKHSKRRIRGSTSTSNCPKSDHNVGKITSEYTRSQLKQPVFSYRNLNVYVVGEVGHPKAQVIRIVHVSDTRGAHQAYEDNLPNGHILIHSGDFVSSPPYRGLQTPGLRCQHSRNHFWKRSGEQSWQAQVAELNDFFTRQPHPYKVFVPGCWEPWRTRNSKCGPTAREIQQLLPSAIYLEDAWCQLFGLRIYGVPWISADELRPEDGASKFLQAFRSSMRRSLDASLRFLRPLPSKSVKGTISSADLSSLNSPSDSNSISTQCDTGSANLPSRGCDSFVLPTIRDVVERWRQIPSNVNVVISHMPAWRQELYTEISERIKPALHLCGHDFTGYGVMWKRGTLFCNAALQLNSTFPYTGLILRKPIKRSKATSSAYDQSNHAKQVAFSIPPDTPSVTAHASLSPRLADLPSNFREPQLYTPQENGRRRPPRWQRRLPACLYRLFFGSNNSARSSTIGQRFRPPPATALVAVTQSTRAAFAHSAGDTDLIYDPDMRAGTGAIAVGGCDNSSSVLHGQQAGGDVLWGGGGRANLTGVVGGTVCSSACRRTALVVDVYVVMEDDSVILPFYHSSSNGPGV